MRLKVKLCTVNDAVLFSAKCNEYDCDIDYLYDSRYVLDAKSLVAVIAAGLEQIREVKVHTNDTSLMRRFTDDMKLWIVEAD